MPAAAKRGRILVVDDSPVTTEVLERNLSAQGYHVYTAPNTEAAMEVLGSADVDLVITDLKMPKASGLELVRHVRENLKHTEVMMVTGYASVEGAVEAVKAGADEYLPKPFTDRELLDAVKRSLRKLERRRTGLGPAAKQDVGKYGLLGRSAPMQTVHQQIRKASQSLATVLISGESGTGKELVARAIHYTSKRAQASFVAVNCAGIPESLLESELFGYVKGAFTGAVESRAGFFQTADGGTIFLDEIGDTSLSMQSKLLRVLQDKQVVMLGSSKPRELDVRILAASNRELRHLVAKGQFREDLYFRINVINIELPPLRERGDDILVLARHFAEEYAKEADKAAPAFSDRAVQSLLRYHWPGNVRELENVVHRLVVMSDDVVVDTPDLPTLMRFSGLRHSRLDRTLAEVDHEYAQNVLASVKGNKTRAAAILGIDRKTLNRKLDPPTASA